MSEQGHGPTLPDLAVWPDPVGSPGTPIVRMERLTVHDVSPEIEPQPMTLVVDAFGTPIPVLDPYPEVLPYGALVHPVPMRMHVSHAPGDAKVEYYHLHRRPVGAKDVGGADIVMTAAFTDLVDTVD